MRKVEGAEEGGGAAEVGDAEVVAEEVELLVEGEVAGVAVERGELPRATLALNFMEVKVDTPILGCMVNMVDIPDKDGTVLRMGNLTSFLMSDDKPF